MFLSPLTSTENSTFCRRTFQKLSQREKIIFFKFCHFINFLNLFTIFVKNTLISPNFSFQVLSKFFRIRPKISPTFAWNFVKIFLINPNNIIFTKYTGNLLTFSYRAGLKALLYWLTDNGDNTLYQILILYADYYQSSRQTKAMEQSRTKFQWRH